MNMEATDLRAFFVYDSLVFKQVIFPGAAARAVHRLAPTYPIQPADKPRCLHGR
jgi:hypothetical protein